ncbi:Protein of unknown function [Gryllus bimaculatus]|nr:Protein of unknown function [Gryllus bimaculatus]
MSTVKTDSHVSSKYEASLVKCYDPGCIILDIHYKDRNMVAETEQIKLFNQDITKYWNTHKDDPVEGRRYHLGEIVAVNVVNSWKAAMIVNFIIKGGLHYYELVLLDTGNLIEVHRMDFRGMDEDVKVHHRFAFFGMMNLIPAGDDARSHPSWNIDACHDLQIMFDLASSITVDMMAKQKFCNSERVFGNIYITIGHHIIDVKENLVKNNSAYENPEAFNSMHALAYEDFFVTHEEIPNREQKLEEAAKYEEIEVEEITDENLDDHLINFWRPGGADPLSHQERMRVRHKLSAEGRITFSRHQSLLESVPSLNNNTRKIQEAGHSDSLNAFQRPAPVDVQAGFQATQGRKFLLSMASSARRDSWSETSKDSSDNDCTDHVTEVLKHLRKPSASEDYESEEYSSSSFKCVASEDYDDFCEPKVERKYNLTKPLSSDSNEFVSDEIEQKFYALFK